MKSQQHRIPPLEGGFKDLDAKIEPLKKWLNSSEASSKTEPMYIAMGHLVTRKHKLIIGGIGTLSVGPIYYVLSKFMPGNAAFFALVFAVIFAMYVLVFWTVRQANSAKKRMLAERKADPLYQRCQLILRAVESYRVHCERYETWQQAANLDLLDRDNKLAVRYQNFIMQAHENLERAISDFLRNAELARVQKEFLEKHQLPSGPDDAALSQLMAKVNEPMEIPDATRVLEPRIRLECEQELQEIFDDPLGERELASRMDALAKR